MGDACIGRMEAGRHSLRGSLEDEQEQIAKELKVNKKTKKQALLEFVWDHPLIVTTIITAFFMAITVAVLVASRI